MERITKTPKESVTQQVHILTQSNLNGNKRLFGGKLLEWIDIVAAVTARRHSNSKVVTARLEAVDFKASAFADDMLFMTGKIVYAGRTSMNICVETFVENTDNIRKLINKSYVTMVAIDENGTPCKVPELIPETDEEINEYNSAKLRIDKRKELENEHLA